MKLRQWADKQGISYLTALRWFKAGKIPNSTQFPSGTIIIQDELPVNTDENKAVHIYARVSSHEKKDDLQRQAQRCVEFANSNGYNIISITKEIASGMNDKRPKLIKLIEQKPKHIIVEHKDRLTRFGFNYFDLLLPMIGCKLTVMNRDQEEHTDLMKDLISVITSFCCKLYGLRRAQNKKQKIQQILEDENV